MVEPTFRAPSPFDEYRKDQNTMRNKNVSLSRLVLIAVLTLLLAFGALTATGCGKKTTNDNGTVTETKGKNGAITLETSATVKVDIPKDKQ